VKLLVTGAAGALGSELVRLTLLEVLQTAATEPVL
jgi:dTDP-4-dehydrorhamnose reductase